MRRQGGVLLNSSLTNTLPISRCKDLYSVRHQSKPQVHHVTAKETQMTDLLTIKILIITHIFT